MLKRQKQKAEKEKDPHHQDNTSVESGLGKLIHQSPVMEGKLNDGPWMSAMIDDDKWPVSDQGWLVFMELSEFWLTFQFIITMMTN